MNEIVEPAEKPDNKIQTPSETCNKSYSLQVMKVREKLHQLSNADLGPLDNMG